MATNTYMYRDANGKIHGIKATSKANADAAWTQLHKTSPLMFEKPGVAAALREIEKRYKSSPDSTMSERMTESATLGGYGYGTRRLAQGRVALQRALPGGDKMPYTADEYYRAAQLYDAARREKYAAEHPGRAFVSDVLGGAVMPGAKLVEGFVTGAKATRLAAEGLKIPKLVRTGQLARMSGTTGAMTAVQAAAQARPGEAKSDAIRQGTTGALLAPAIAVGIPLATKLGSKVVDTVSGMVAPKTATQLATDKLAALLQRAQVAPADIRDALAHYTSTGSIDPSVYDVLRKAGAGPDILRFFQVSGSYPTTRTAAMAHAEETTKALPQKTIAAARNLPTSGETRTPAQIREEQAAEAARVKQETEQATAGVAPAPTGPARGSGASELFKTLNDAYDASKNAYTQTFEKLKATHPESAIVADEQRVPLRTAIYQSMSQYLNPNLSSTKDVAKIFDDLVEGIVPPSQTRLPDLPENVEKYLADINPADRPKFEANVRKSLKLDTPVEIPGAIPANARPLTVSELFEKRRALGEFADKLSASGDNEAAGAANAAKTALDNELTRLSSEGHIQGEPEMIDLANQGIQEFAQHMGMFGEGLAETLTKRVPGKPTQTVLKPYQAGDAIFGKGENVRNLNDIRADLEPIIPIVPGAVSAVRNELFTRIPAEDLPRVQARFNETFDELLPENLTAAAAAAQQRAAQVEAQNAQLLANTEAQRAQTEGAVGLGEKLRSLPADEFVRAVSNVPSNLQPLVQAGGRQQLINDISERIPGSTGLLNQLQSPRVTENLNALYGGEGEKFQQTLKDLGEQATGTQELVQSVGGQTPLDTSMVELPAGLGRPSLFAARVALAKLRSKTRLSPEESLELYNLMKSQGASNLSELEGMARVQALGSKKYREYPDAAKMQHYLEKIKDVPQNALPGLNVALTKAFTAPEGDAAALERMKEEYGLNY